jgi:sensor histidine kinase YesM
MAMLDRGGWRVSAGLIGFWAVCAVLAIAAFWTGLSIGTVRMQGDSSLPTLIRLQGVPWLAAAIVTPGVIYWSMRLRWLRAGWPAAIAGHTAGVIVFAVLYVLLTITLHMLFLGRGFEMEWQSLVGRLAGSAVLSVTIYACIVGATGTYMALEHAAAERRASGQLARVRVELERDLATMRLVVLRQQLQPHFLFNALNAVSGLIELDPPRARRLLARIADLLRIALRRSQDAQATLADELDFAERFLEVERERLGDRLTVRYEVADRLLAARLPSFAVQPLVENAVRHGISRLERGGTVTIAAAEQGREIAVSVTNDMLEEAPAGPEGTGLSSLRSRLKGMYGESAALQTSMSNGRFSAIMTIPTEPA